MKENIILQKALLFGVRIIKLSKYLDDRKEKILANQILRSGTSIGANVAESEYSASKADFVNKLHIAQKEAGETKYWLQLLKLSLLIDEKMFESMCVDVDKLLKMIGTSLVTAKK